MTTWVHGQNGGAPRPPWHRPQATTAPPLRSDDGLLHEPGFADPRLPYDEDDPSGAGEGFFDLALQRSELVARPTNGRRWDPPGRRPPTGCLLRRGTADRPDGPNLLRRLEGTVVLQHRPFQALQRPARVDAELLGEDPAGILVHVQRCRPGDRTGKRQHQLCTEPLPEGVLAHQLGQRPDDIAVAPRCHLHIDQ